MNDLTKQGYVPDTVMRNLIRDNSLLLQAISRFNIAFGFGDETVRQVCQKNNVDIDTFLCVCNMLSGYPYDASTLSLSALMDYLKRAHTSFIEIELPKIRHHLVDGINFNGKDEVALLLMKFYDDYVLEAKRHMEYENNVIFRYTERLLKGEVDEQFNIIHYSSNHSDTVTKLNELKDIFIYHFKERDNARLSSALLDIIICGKDLVAHFDVESRLFIPAVEQLERSLRKNQQRQEDEDPSADEISDAALAMLSEREKDIVRGISQGKVNKEIADDLCISVHTVATHRRNICAKLGIHTTAGLTVFAIINHLVELHEVKPT